MSARQTIGILLLAGLVCVAAFIVFLAWERWREVSATAQPSTARTEQIPAISCDVDEHDDAPVRLRTRFADELHAG